MYTPNHTSILTIRVEPTHTSVCGLHRVWAPVCRLHPYCKYEGVIGSVFGCGVRIIAFQIGLASGIVVEIFALLERVS